MSIPEVLEYVGKLRSVLSRAVDLLRDLRIDVVSFDDGRRGQIDDLIVDAEELLG